MDTDSQLIAALARDLDGSFEALVLAHQDRLYSIALRMLGDAGDAEEAAQDALVRAYRALAGVSGRADPRAPAPAVAGDDRPQPVPLADRAAGRVGPAAAVARRGGTRDARTADRRADRAGRDRRPARCRPEPGRPCS